MMTDFAFKSCVIVWIAVPSNEALKACAQTLKLAVLIIWGG